MVSVRETYAFDLDMAREAAARWSARKMRYGKFPDRARCREFSKIDAKERLAKRANRLLARLNRVAPERAARIAASLRLRGDVAEQVRHASVTSESVNDLLLERVIGETRDFQSVEFVEKAVHVAHAVCRITTQLAAGGVSHGTGFMVSPSLMLTNHHVVASADAARASVAEFDYQRDRLGRDLTAESRRLVPERFFLSDDDLDFTLVAVEGDPGRRFGWCPLFGAEGKVVAGEPVNLIQHPRGERKQIVIRSNRVMDLRDAPGPFLHYEADTEPGSSGSPVFNDQWELVALHHSGVPRRDAKGRILAIDGGVWTDGQDPFRIAWIGNEGIRVSRLVRFMVAARVAAAQKPLLDEVTLPLVPEVAPGGPVSGGTARANGHGASPRGTDLPPLLVNLSVPVQVSVSGGDP